MVPIYAIVNPYRCDCCNKQIITTKTIQLDHCHKSGLFRGWLCKECNISITNLGDDISGLIRAIKYMNRAEKKSLDEIKNEVEVALIQKN